MGKKQEVEGDGLRGKVWRVVLWGWRSKVPSLPHVTSTSHEPRDLHQTHEGRENAEQTPGVVTGFCTHNIRRKHFTLLLNITELECSRKCSGMRTENPAGNVTGRSGKHCAQVQTLPLGPAARIAARIHWVGKAALGLTNRK